MPADNVRNFNSSIPMENTPATYAFINQLEDESSNDTSDEEFYSSDENESQNESDDESSDYEPLKSQYETQEEFAHRYGIDLEESYSKVIGDYELIGH